MKYLHHVVVAAVLILAVAVVARMAWELLRPLVPALVVLTVFGVVFGIAFGKFRK